METANEQQATATTNERKSTPIVLPPRGAEKAREEMTVREQMAARDANVAMMRVEAEVRRLAREEELSAKREQELVERARVSFRVVDGRAVPVGADGRTVLMSEDGARVITVAEWFERSTSRRPSPQSGEGEERGTSPGEWKMENGKWKTPMRNPFRKKFWNLTEQMRLRKSDPEFAGKLEAEAWATAD